MARSFGKASNRLVRNGRQLFSSDVSGLLPGGAQRTALVTALPISFSESSGRASNLPVAKPNLIRVS
jgi:hypothetical protein